MKNKKVFTLVFVKQNNSLLMGYKTRGLGVGLWNGFGGKVENNENYEEAALRELKEESNLETDSLKHIGVVIYEEDKNDILSVIHIFTAKTFAGPIIPSEEMNPIQWYGFKELPYESMWPDAKFWYPLMFNDKFFSAYVKYDSDGVIKNKEIYEFDCLENVLKNLNITTS